MVAEIDEVKCTGCGNCLYVCPVGVLEIVGTKCRVNEGCTSCGICVDLCDFKAITVPDRKPKTG